MKKINGWTKVVLILTLFLVVATVTVRCGQDVCIAGIGAGCATSGTTGTVGSGGTNLQINVSGNWPRQTAHLQPSNAGTGYNSILPIVVTGGTQPYQAMTILNPSNCANPGTAPSLTAGAAGFIGTFTAPAGACPVMALVVTDSSSPQLTAYMPLTIDPQ
jgi:hypothetical protein